MGHYGCTVCNEFKHHYNLCHQLAFFVTTFYILFYNIFTYMDHGVFILFGKLILLTLTWNSQLVKIYETYWFYFFEKTKVNVADKKVVLKIICAGATVSLYRRKTYLSWRLILPLSKMPLFVSLSWVFDFWRIFM